MAILIEKIAFFIGKINFFHPWMFWTSPAAPKKVFSSLLGVPNLACGAKKKHSPAGSVESGGSENAKNHFSHMPAKKKHSRPPRKFPGTEKCEKSFFANGVRKKTFTAPPIWGVRKKKKHSPLRRSGACEKKTFTTVPEMAKMQKKIFRTRLESLRQGAGDLRRG